jgi:hypothetical protein
LFHTVFDRRDPAQLLVRSVVVVSVQPISGHVSDLLQGIEYVAVQHLGAVSLVEAFHMGVLGGFAGLDVVEGNALGLGPLRQGLGNELEPV